MTEILLVAVDPDLVDRVGRIGGHRVVSIDRYNVRSGKHVGAAVESDFHPDLILVGSGVSTDDAIEYGRVVVGDHPDIAVVLVAQLDEEQLVRAVDAGIADVIDLGISDDELETLIGRGPVEPAPVPTTDLGGRHQVIVVASPKGGVGKTMTTVNVAALLAQSAPGEVVVLDLDLQFGDVATVLDLEPQYTVSDAFTFGIDDSMRLRTLLVPHKANFHVLCGSANPAANGHVTGDQIRKLVSHYSAAFRYVVVDTPAGLHEETLASLEEATDVIFVAGLDVATLRAMRREIDILDELSLLPPRRHVVLNRADGRSGLLPRDVERIVGLPVDAVVPLSDRVALAANKGELAVAGRRRNVVRRPLMALTKAVADPSSQKGVAHR